MLVCTNFDEDHVSGFPDLAAQGITVGCILGNPTVPANAIVQLKTEDGMGPGIRAVANVLDARAKAGIVEKMPVIPGVFFGWSCNPYPGAFEDENNLSLVLHMNIHGFKFMFPGDLETAGFRNLFRTLPQFRRTVSELDVLVASHHGRANGICPEMFDEYGCNPQLVVISDDFKRYNTQETTAYYATKTKGISQFRGGGNRKVLTTRSDREILFSFKQGRCFVL
jgi:beta-lactamase superfamily II metal-dependent hydrolase